MINIVMPMAGLGTPFVEKGYTFPKPLIEISGKPMIQIVVENLRPNQEHRFIFIVRKEHLERYSMKNLLEFISPGCKIVPIEKLTAGAACSVLLAKGYINNNDPLIIANSDQYLDININDFVGLSSNTELDGNIITFSSTHPKWSFVKIDNNGNLSEVAEKKPISDKATAGIYYFSRGIDFCDAAESMIEKEISVNGEFFVCPVYNEMILENKKIKTVHIDRKNMHGMGTPEDLADFEKHYESSKE
jgi:NDP-sugar pyrophosphorylase family protein